MENKNGQFYILAAVVIIALVIGLLAITNYAEKKEDTRVYELAKELKIETQRMLEYGAATGNYPWDSFTKNFTEYSGKNIEITYIIGNTSFIESYYYNKTGLKTPRIGYLNLTDEKYYLGLDSIEYKFKIRKGQNFYFIITQKIGEDRYVATNE